MPSSAEMLPLDPRARLLFHATAAVRLVTLGIPTVAMVTIGLVVLVAPVPGLVIGAVLLLLQMLFTVWMPALSFERYGWQLDDHELLVQRGVVFRNVTAIPVGRVQHVDVRQGPLEQWLGLARVHVHTASGVGADGVVPGLDLQTAQELRDRLVAASERDDGV
ncbi:MAG: PH domain-containing protein [Myxococcota bacterium]